MSQNPSSSVDVDSISSINFIEQVYSKRFNNISMWLLALIVITLPNCDSAVTTSSNTRQYPQLEAGIFELNTYLDRVSQGIKEPELLLDKAERLLIEVGGKNSKLEDAIKMMLQLKELNNKTTCNKGGQIVISNINSATNGLAKYGLRPTDRVVFHHLVHHAKMCLAEYINNSAEVVEKVDEEVRRRVDRFVNQVVELDMLDLAYAKINPLADSLSRAIEIGPPVEFIRLMDDLGEVRPRNIMDALKFASGLDDLPRERAHLEQIIDEFIYGPCEKFVQEVGANLYDPFMEDYQTLMDDRHSNVSQMIKKLAASQEFFMSLAQVKACKVYALDLNKDTLLDSMLTMMDG